MAKKRRYSMKQKKYQKHNTKETHVSLRKELLLYVLAGGVIMAGLSQPYLLVPAILIAHFQSKGYKKKEIQDAFYSIQKNGFISVQTKRKQNSFSLTNKGVRKAQKYALLQLPDRNPQKWDGKWRLIIFDVPSTHRLKRDALRSFIKKLGCKQLQKSIWIYPHDCKEEVKLLQKFFSFSELELRIILAEDIGNDTKYRKLFKLS